MKKTLSLILVLTLCLSLCACGTGGTKPLLINEVITDQNIELCIIGSSFATRGPLAIEPIESTSTNTEDDVYLTVYIGVKNIGKTEYSVNSSIIGTLDYGDGYTFQANACSKLDSCNWVGDYYILPDKTLSDTLTTLQPLSDAELLAIVFVVPSEVMNKTENAATLNIILEEKQYTYDVRTPSNILSIEENASELAKDVISQYREAWLIRNISYNMELLYEDVDFVKTYVGNTNSAGKLKFADEKLNEIKTAFEPVYEQVSLEEINLILPSTASALRELQASCEALCDQLDKMGETNNAAYVYPIKESALHILISLENAATTDEFMKYGRFTSFD